MTFKIDREILKIAYYIEKLAFEMKAPNIYTPKFVCLANEIRTAIHTRLAQPEQEPVEIGTEWTPCVKLPVTVHVRQQRPGETHVSTREGITPVKPDDLIMRGVSGEEYPIGREIFELTYQLGEAQTKPEQEPVAWMYSEGLAALKAGKCWTAYGTKQDKDNSIPLYTAPPERQPLTYAEMKKIADKHLKSEYQPASYGMSGVFDLIRAVEYTKLKEMK